MMGERTRIQEALFYKFSLERHVPKDHLVRRLDRFVDLSALRGHLRAFCSDIGHPSVMIARDERGCAKPGFQIPIEVSSPLSAAIDESRDLLIVWVASDGSTLQSDNGVANGFHDRREAFELHSAFPHCHLRFVLGRGAKQRHNGIGLFEITLDRGNFTDRSAVFEHGPGHDAPRIDLGVTVGELLPSRRGRNPEPVIV